MFLIVGMKTHKIYAKGAYKADCLRELQGKYPGKLDDKTLKKLGKTSNYNNTDILPEPMKFYRK